MMGWDNMMNGSGMGWMSFSGLLVLVVLILCIVALVKYIGK